MSIFIPQTRTLRPLEILQKLVFPNVYIHEIELGPKDLFGMPGEVDRRVMPTGRTVRAIWDANSGSITHDVELIEPPNISNSVMGFQYTLSGNILKVTAHSPDLRLFTEFCIAVSTRLPLLLSLSTLTDVRILRHHIKTEHGLIRNEYTSVETHIKGTNKETVESELSLGIKNTVLLQKDNQRLLSSLYYFNHALSLSSLNDPSMLSEILLNYYKAVEIIFGSTADDVRKKAKELKVYNKRFETFLVSLVYVRNSIDVAHSSLSSLGHEDEKTIDLYASGVGHELRRVLGLLVDTCTKKAGLFYRDVHKQDKERQRTLAQIRSNMLSLSKSELDKP